MSHILQQIEFPQYRRPPPIVANDSADLFKQAHAEGSSNSILSVRRLDEDLVAAGSRSVPISVHGVSEERSMIPVSSDLCLQ